MGAFYNVLLAMFAATGSFLFGYDNGVMTDVIASPNFLMFFDTENTSPIIGAINSTFSGGAVFGSLMGGFTMDRFGRKTTIQIGAAIATVGGVLQCAAVNLAMILVGRIISGWAVGLMSMSVPVYQAECAHPKMRGLIVGLTQQMIGIGFIVSTWVGYGSHHARGEFQWRFPLGFQVIPSVLLLVGLIWLPESPRYLVEKDRDDAAMKILRTLHYNGTNDDWVQNEYNEIRATITAEKSVTVPGWKVMFTVPQWRKRLMLATLIQVFTQFTGINVIGYYQTVMYEALGIVGSRAVLVAGIYNCVGPIANAIFIFFILDRESVGRKKPLLLGAAAITVALFAEAGLNAVNPDGAREGYSIGGVFCLFLVSVTFSFSFGPISWVYTSEILPMQIRGRGSALAISIGNWLVSTFWSQVSPIALGSITWRFYFIFATWNILVTIPTIWFVFPETNRKSLEEIDLLFGERALGTLPDNIRAKTVDEALRQETKAEKRYHDDGDAPTTVEHREETKVSKN